jgi:hypothetical protein
MRAYDLTNASWHKSSYSNQEGGNCVEVGRDFVGAARWRKSTHSNQEGGDCLEVGEGFPGAARWRKSTYSNQEGGSCLEVADGLPGVVPVRDSKVAGGDVVVVGAGAWAAFVAGVRRDAAA